MRNILETIKSFVLSLFGKWSKNGKLAFQLSYFHNRAKWPDLEHPKDLSEIWIKKVLDGEINTIASLADKYAVRSFVEEKGLADILTPLLGVYEKPDEIDLASFPNRFALKANYGAGKNIICLDKSKLDFSFVYKEMNKWFMVEHYSESERHYNLIPKKIIGEEFIDDGTGGFPVDYKFICIHGKVHCVLGVSGRENGHGSFLPYSKDWQPLREYYRGNAAVVDLLPRPTNLEEMITTAERLASGIDLVRVDLYSNGTRIWFGEMTLTPSGCIFHRWSQYALDQMGMVYRQDLQ